MGANIWLIGMMGSGKSSVGRALSEKMGFDFADSDDVVTTRMGCSIAEFWGSRGEAAFRDMEAAVIAELAQKGGHVIATGGGAILRAANVAAMRDSGTVVWLQAHPHSMAQRTAGGSRRPLLADADPVIRLSELLAERSEAYETAAHVAVATDGLEIATVVDRIEELWSAY